jgi:3-hydroxybutyryl-CoA dehydrogenase
VNTPESIVDRVGRGYFLEPLRMLGEGVAGVDEIDRILTQLGGFRAGPFEQMDAVGLDVDHAIMRRDWEQLGRPGAVYCASFWIHHSGS